ncbi:S8 family serine peptidase, partial [Parabacteroides distasonis]|nr:S8 family serine peptidase [Parabacteroides distasonis]
AYNNVVSVGAININNELIDFSPAYDGVDIVAPGIDILSSIPEKNNSVELVYYENGDIYTDFKFHQIDKGVPYLKYPQN